MGKKGPGSNLLPPPCPDSLLPPGQQQAVIEEMQVDGLAGQLQLGGGRCGQWGQLHQFPMPNQPAGLRDQWEDLEGWRRQGGGRVRPRTAGQKAQNGEGWGRRVRNWPEETRAAPLRTPSRQLQACTLPSKWIFLLRWISSSVLFMDCTLALHSCTSWGGRGRVTCAPHPHPGSQSLASGSHLETRGSDGWGSFRDIPGI